MEELQPLTDRYAGEHQQIPRKPVASVNKVHQPPSNSRNGDAKRSSKLGHPRASYRTLPEPFKKIWKYAWIVEILSFVLAVIALAATYIMLAVHNDRPMPQWPKLISINTLISIFTAILKASLMMPVAQGIGQLKWQMFEEPRPLIDLERIDEASRGPWGSLLLIGTLYKNYLALFGAIITVVALAIDPFSQQVVQYYECAQPILGSVASIPKTNNYTRAGSGTSSDSNSLDSTMAAALYVGLIQPPQNATSSIPIQCQSGNCTFPSDGGATHSSLAMCGSCADISREVKRNATQNANSSLISYTLSSGPTIGLPPTSFYTSDLVWMASTAYGSVDSTPGIDYVSGFDTLMYRESGCTNATEINSKCNYEPFAVQCHIYPCVKTYNASITNFVLEERLLNTTRVPMNTITPEVSSSFGGGFTLLSDSVLRDGTWVNCDGVDTPTKTHSASGPPQWTTKAQPPPKYYPNDCVWNFGWQSTQALAFSLYSLFDGENVNSTLPPDTPARAQAPPWNLPLFANGTATLDTANAYVTGLTNAMTSIIRQNGVTPTSGYVLGTASNMQTCIRVRWAWLALPSALIVLAMGFLIATIIQTRAWQRTWKSSALALLFHGLDSRSRQRYGPLVELSGMEAAAEEVRAKLTTQEAGWRFVIEE